VIEASADLENNDAGGGPLNAIGQRFHFEERLAAGPHLVNVEATIGDDELHILPSALPHARNRR